VILSGGEFTFWENCVGCLSSGLKYHDYCESDDLKYCD